MLAWCYEQERGRRRTQWVTATQLWLLIVLALELVADAVEQLHVALVGVLLERRDESVGHGARSLTCNVGIGSDDDRVSIVHLFAPTMLPGK